MIFYNPGVGHSLCAGCVHTFEQRVSSVIWSLLHFPPSKKGKTDILKLFSSLTFGARDLKPSRGDRSWSNLAPHDLDLEAVPDLDLENDLDFKTDPNLDNDLDP